MFVCFMLQDDLIGKSVYNIIHVGDHAQFSNSLLQSYSKLVYVLLITKPSTVVQ